jgi:hypothetical protein
MIPEEKNLSEQLIREEIAYWLKVKREASAGSLTPLEEAAKQVVVITSLLQGIYFAAISFSNIKQVGNTSNMWFNLFVGISLITIALWMASLYFATRVFVPEIYSSTLNQTTTTSNQAEFTNQVILIREAFDKISTYKHQKLTTAVELLWWSFIPFALNILIYLIFLPAPPPK